MNYKKFLKSKKKETAIEAIERYEGFLKVVTETAEDFEESLSLFLVEYSNPSDIEQQILKTETKYNIQLPKSYKKFMLEKGPFGFGVGNFDSYLYPPHLDNLIEEMIDKECYPDIASIKKDYREENFQKIEQMLVFKKTNDYDFHCFDISTYNPKTKEMDICDNGQDDWVGYNLDYASFDAYMVQSVNEQIESVIDYLEQ